MKLTGDQKAFLKDQKEKLIALFRGRIEDLKDMMIAQEIPLERDRIIEAIKENKRWLADIEEQTSNKKVKRDTSI
ncbi:MAG TPA: hypothetical protein ENH85_01215 [Candidatus Scalindua sp.]|nr:hypothetical protein [Candidatus Scalindua sp.]